jgi:hypothetical protein
MVKVLGTVSNIAQLLNGLNRETGKKFQGAKMNLPDK